MAVPCAKNDSIPPLCTIHGVQLVWQLVPLDSTNATRGLVNRLICPVGGFVVLEVGQ